MAQAAIIGLTVVGTALSAVSQIQAGRAAAAQGEAQQQASEYTAKQREVQAGQERGRAQRAAAEERRRKRIVQSNLTAAAAASGAGAADPTVVDLAGDIEEEGEFRALTAIFEGEERARQLESGAILDRYEGRAARSAGKARQSSYRTAALGTVVGGAARIGSSLYEKYGGGDPGDSPP